MGRSSLNDEANGALADYLSFVADIDKRMRALHARHGARITCHRGCDDCCRVERSALPVEGERLRRALASLPSPTIDRLRQSRQPDQCALLLDGLCVVYEARPLICRTHGAPLLLDADGEVGVSICDLNMAGFSDISGFSDDDLLDTITMNDRLLALNDNYVAVSNISPNRVELAALFLK